MKTRARRTSRQQASASALATGADLARAWAQARVFNIGDMCQCAGGAHLAIDPQAAAEDVLFYLVDKYRGEKLDGLAAFVEAAHARDFESWLEALDTAPLADADRGALLRDLGRTVESMQAPAGFMCV
jgi:hypothetical protein